MKKTISQSDFEDAFKAHERESNFTREGLRALFAYLEDQERDLGEEYELDVIGLCCTFSEYESAIQACENYDWDKPDQDEGEALDEYEDRAEEEARDYLRERTTLIEVEGGGVIIHDF